MFNFDENGKPDFETWEKMKNPLNNDDPVGCPHYDEENEICVMTEKVPTDRTREQKCESNSSNYRCCKHYQI